MQVKVCPKCSAENKPTSSVCSSCYASLDKVSATKSAKIDQQVIPPVSLNTTRQRQSNNKIQTNSQPFGEPIPQPQSTQYPPGSGPSRDVPGYSSQYNTKQHSKENGSGGFIAFLIIAIFIGALAFAGYNIFKVKPLTPIEQVMAAINAMESDKWETRKPYLSKSSIDLLIKMIGSEEEIAKKLNASSNDRFVSRYLGQRTEITNIKFENKNTAVADIYMSASMQAQLDKIGSDIKPAYILIYEDGRFKMDLPQTQKRLMEQVEKAVKKKYGSNAPNFGNLALPQGSQPQGTLPMPQ